MCQSEVWRRRKEKEIKIFLEELQCRQKKSARLIRKIVTFFKNVKFLL